MRWEGEFNKTIMEPKITMLQPKAIKQEEDFLNCHQIKYCREVPNSLKIYGDLSFIGSFRKLELWLEVLTSSIATVGTMIALWNSPSHLRLCAGDVLVQEEANYFSTSCLHPQKFVYF